MRQEKISIKWKIFLYLLTFAGILLLVLWLIQICYLDTFYKKIKTRYAEKIISETIAILRSGEEDAEEKIDELAAENNVAVFVTDMEGNALYDAEYIANSRIGSMSVDRFKEYCMLARDNGGYAKIEFFGEYSKEKRDLMLPRGAGQFRDEGTQDGQETSEKPQEDPEDMAGSIPSGEWKQAARDDLVWQKMPEHTEEQEQSRGGAGGDDGQGIRGAKEFPAELGAGADRECDICLYCQYSRGELCPYGEYPADSGGRHGEHIED